MAFAESFNPDLGIRQNNLEYYNWLLRRHAESAEPGELHVQPDDF